MKPTAYIETTIVSYLTARPSRDLVIAAHQEATRDWWSVRLGRGRSPRNGLSCDVELHPHRHCHHAWADRSHLQGRRI